MPSCNERRLTRGAWAAPERRAARAAGEVSEMDACIAACTGGKARRCYIGSQTPSDGSVGALAAHEHLSQNSSNVDILICSPRPSPCTDCHCCNKKPLNTLSGEFKRRQAPHDSQCLPRGCRRLRPAGGRVAQADVHGLERQRQGCPKEQVTSTATEHRILQWSSGLQKDLTVGHVTCHSCQFMKS
jgi:hypothetical protein